MFLGVHSDVNQFLVSLYIAASLESADTGYNTVLALYLICDNTDYIPLFYSIIVFTEHTK